MSVCEDAAAPSRADMVWRSRCSHAPAGRLAAATAALYVVCFPLGALAALITDSALHWRLVADRPTAATSTISPSIPRVVDDAAVFEHRNPLSIAVKSMKAQPADRLGVISTPCPTDDRTLAPFLAECTPRAWWFKLTDLGAGVYQSE